MDTLTLTDIRKLIAQKKKTALSIQDRLFKVLRELDEIEEDLGQLDGTGPAMPKKRGRKKKASIKDIDDIERDLQKLEGKGTARKRGPGRPKKAAKAPKAAKKSAPRKPRTPKVKEKTLSDYVAEVLTREALPLSVGVLTTEVEKLGYKSANTSRGVSAATSLGKMFLKVGDIVSLVKEATSPKAEG